ncbi:MAG TPA: DJ-1/PfpI family protein, partial [Acetobacteraceae bacterium]|nr:DJ-1/PfpI family protein [Acetobacteraceae bacterium]
MPKFIQIIAFDGAQVLDVTGPLQAFASANELSLLDGAAAPYRLKVASPAGGAVLSSAGLGLLTERMADETDTPGAPPDTVIIAGGPGVRAVANDPAVVAQIADRAKTARRVASVCTGAFLLAATGLLDGRCATTHWRWCAELARRHPRVRVEPDPIYVRDGPIWTSAGVTAGIDLAIALIEDDFGRDLSLAVARHLVMFLKRPGGQAQFSAELHAQHAGSFGDLHAWIATHLGRELSVAELAAQVGMSERSFCRRYRAATGTTPARAVERLRVEAARRALCETGQPIKRIARRVGFGSEETLRRSFLRVL